MKPAIKVTFDVDKCHLPRLDGTHTVNLNLKDLSEDDFEQYALRSIVINLQATIRRTKADEQGNVRSFENYTVPKPGSRISTGDKIEKVKSILNKLTEEQKKAIAESMGFAYVPAGLPDPADAHLEEGEQLPDGTEDDETPEESEETTA